MAKTKPSTLPPSKPSHLLHHAPSRPRPRKSKPAPSPANLLAEASSLLISSSPDRALPLALRALNGLQTTLPTTAALPALNLLAQIQLELGDGNAAREYFLRAVEIDPDGRVAEGEGGGAEKFLWLAQLSEEGGRDSVDWFERGCAVLRWQIDGLEELMKNVPPDSAKEDAGGVDLQNISTEADTEVRIQGKREKLAEALCGIVEIYMTDLSLEPDAESQCESLIAEALRVAPQSPEPLQTLASVRISQLRTEEAKVALTQSLGLWSGKEGEEVAEVDEEVTRAIPDFPTRISLARLLMEVSMLEEALTVLERLVNEDDQSVEAWYLGGWCLYLAAEMNKDSPDTPPDKEELKNSRQWLQESLRLYNLLEYEDDRLRDHAVELVTDLNRELGEGADDDPGVEEGWEDEDEDEGGDSDEDQEMEGT